MAPREERKGSYVLFENEQSEKDFEKVIPRSAEDREWDIVWPNVFIFLIAHIAGLYGCYLFLGQVKLLTCIFAFVVLIIAGLGITAGVHRLWSHRAYKARFPLRVILAIFNSMAFQHPVLRWARDHRAHHKYSDTDADPYNATRGFFFSHIGWLLLRKHPEVKTKGQQIDLSDLYADPVLRYQEKYYMPLMLVTCFILPTYIPTLWGETAWNAFFVCAVFRFIVGMNVTWLINSAAHKWGYRPYDKNINPGDDKILALMVLGEGYHNYHHTFPWDYRTAELGAPLNLTTRFINLMAKIGWAYDMKSVSKEVIEKRKMRTGDNNHEEHEINNSVET
ncbi:acyl-CoA Delta-9 desaturase-like [Galleria mellonella]|uniref:Acyl-CoA Delta-9 desaturase-like n=1 Tax=Galleria mellonella TaxID=7137 RepID=A0ABM3MXR0_GALME|nr:acyl-CoA Delta-9 desaturase-like [Galleria mellonella]